MDVVCMECGKKFKTRAVEPQCPKCGGYDVEPNTHAYISTEHIHNLRIRGLEARR